MLLLLVACDVPATAWPVDPCRLGASFDAVTADVTCAAAGRTIEATFAWADATRAGAVQGEAWDGLSFYATGTTAQGGTVSVGHRGGVPGVYAREGTRELVANFLPASTELPVAPHLTVADGDATCDAATGSGAVTLAGLPEELVPGGVWEMAFDAGSFDADTAEAAWTPPWPVTCPLSPAAWSSVRVSASCAGEERAAVQFLAPASYAVELDALGQIATASATWPEAFSAVCDGGVLPSLDGSLQAAAGEVRLYTPVLTVVRDAVGTWAIESSSCGEACDAWVVTVEGLPEL